MSLYLPNILKGKISLFLDEKQKKLSVYDFQCVYSRKNELRVFRDL